MAVGVEARGRGEARALVYIYFILNFFLTMARWGGNEVSLRASRFAFRFDAGGCPDGREVLRANDITITKPPVPR